MVNSNTRQESDQGDRVTQKPPTHRHSDRLQGVLIDSVRLSV